MYPSFIYVGGRHDFQLMFLAGIFFSALFVALILLFRRVQAKLCQQKVLLDAALENMSQGLCMHDPNGRHRTV